MNSTVFELFQKMALLVFTPACFDKYFLEFDIMNGPCFSTTLSKALGLAIILGSVMVKIPQILKIYNAQSGEGISLLSVSLDLGAITIYMSYSFVKDFPFTAWGDAAFLAVQTVLIGALVLFYDGKLCQSLLYVISYLGLCFVMMSGVTSLNILWTLQTFNILLVVVGKLLQALTNYKNGHTGQLSALTLFMLLGGSLARIFTSMQETGDSVVIITYISSSLANLVLVIQLWYYWNVKIKAE